MFSTKTVMFDTSITIGNIFFMATPTVGFTGSRPSRVNSSNIGNVLLWQPSPVSLLPPPPDPPGAGDVRHWAKMLTLLLLL